MFTAYQNAILCRLARYDHVLADKVRSAEFGGLYVPDSPSLKSRQIQILLQTGFKKSDTGYVFMRDFDIPDFDRVRDHKKGRPKSLLRIFKEGKKERVSWRD